MSKRLEVVYENGVLRSLEPVDVREHQRGTVTLIEPEEDWLDTEYMDSCAAEVQEHVSLETVRQILSKIPESLAEEIRAERDARQMATYFLDSSALVKHYHAEAGTAEVDRLLSPFFSRYLC